MTSLANETGFQERVDSDAAKIVAETQAKALASHLASMRKELHMFASPFYLEHLASERAKLRAKEKVLQAELETAEAGLKKTWEKKKKVYTVMGPSLRGQEAPVPTVGFALAPGLTPARSDAHWPLSLAS